MVANLLAFHLFFTSILFWVVGAYSLRHRQFTAAIPFSVAMFLLGAFTLFAGLDVITPELGFKVTLMRLRLSILPFTPVTVLVVAIRNARRFNWISAKRIALLAIIPTISLLFVWIPGLESYFRSNYQVVDTGFSSALTYTNGDWFWVIAVYSGILSLSIFGIQFNNMLNSQGVYFKQNLFLNLGQIIPAIILFLAQTGRLELINGYNYTPHWLMLTALLNGWAIFHYQWLFTAPMARDIAIDLMSDLMLVINEFDRISDANAAAKQVFEITDESFGKDVKTIIPAWGEIRTAAQTKSILRTEFSLQKNNLDKFFELTANPARNPNDETISAYVLILRDITEQKRQREQIKNLVEAVSQSPNSVLITDQNGIIEYVNLSFTRLTGFESNEVVGKKTSIFKSGKTPESIYLDLWKTIKSGKIWKGDLLNRRKDGDLYWEETLIAPLFDSEGYITNYISIKEDISARKEVDEILHRRLEELLMVNTISMAAASQLDLTSLVSLVGQQLEQSFDANSVLIALHRNGSAEIEVPYWTIARKRVSPPPQKYGEGLVSHILMNRQPLLIATNFKETAATLGHKPIFANQYGYPKTWLGVPIMAGPHAMGVISLQNYESDFAYNNDDIRLLNTIAASIGVAIENANMFQAAQQEIEERIRAEQESRERADQMSVLYEVSHAITAGLDLEMVLNSLMEKCKQIAPVDVFTVGLYEPAGSMINFIKFNDKGKERLHLQFHISPEENITSKVIKDRETVYVADCHSKESKQQYRWKNTSREHVRSYLGIPLICADCVTGVLSVQSYQSDAFKPEQIQTLEIIAFQAAIAIENARLYDITRRRAEEMTLLYEISMELSANLNMDEVLRNLLEKCRQLMPMDSFYVAVYEETSNMIYYPLFYDQGEFKTIPVRDIRTTPGLTGEVIMSAKTIYLPDTTDKKTAEHYQIIHIGGTPTRSFVGVPMIVRGKVIGVISMQAYQAHHYSAEQIRLLETIATQAAIAVENSRLYAEARKEINERRRAQESIQQTNQELEVQLRYVESLQEKLREQAIHDSLTGLYNRRYLDEIFPQQISLMERKTASLAVLMLDIDQFKSFNDTYGHKAGDEMLTMLGKLLRQYTRQSDVACRYGGEEFIVLLADTTLEIASKRAEEFRQNFESNSILIENQNLRTTVSIGIAIYPEHSESPEGLLIQADQALYAAKSNGRNCVVAWKR